MQPFRVAVKGKGIKRMLKRAVDLREHYGLNPNKMDHQLARFVEILEKYQCGATFPITSVVLERNQRTISKYINGDIEFAVHGYYHTDQTQNTSDKQKLELIKSRAIFRKSGIESYGFRSPYLRANGDTLEALKKSGFLYDSSQAVFLNVAKDLQTESYQRALDFYRAIPGSHYPLLPYWENGLLRIPYCLPDDEALVERMQLGSDELMAQVWLSVLEETYQRGELFTLGLHPERISSCQKALSEVLKTARVLSPKVWIARLNEIANWWVGLKQTKVSISDVGQGHIKIHVDGTPGLSLLVRGAEVSEPSLIWNKGYRLVPGNELNVHSNLRPFIGLSKGAHVGIETYLRQQGYIIERTEIPDNYSYFIDWKQFGRQDERSLLAEFEGGDFPLVRIGRWPNGAQSALSVTGDIDAITLYDYSLRLVGQ
jgi:peptidoglycan/xylan/chitin deacetylase (PgdA/CDA1 family)